MSWLVYIIVFAFGLLGGFLWGRNNNSESRARELELHLKSLQAKYDHYQESVTQHFSTSAQLTNALTQAYRELHGHLAHGAQTLCSDAKRHGNANPASAFLPLGTPTGNSRLASMDPNYLSTVAPPRDYADKTPDDKGTLDEDYGLK